MSNERWTRRGALGALAAGCLSLSGCVGRVDCSSDAAVVFRSQLHGWYVDYPARAGLFGFGSENGEAPARRLARLARQEGYVTEYYFSEDLGRGNDDSWQVELYGTLDRETVERLVRAAEMPEGTEISEREETISRGSGLKWPWAPGLLEARAKFLEANAPTVGVRLPPFGPASEGVVTLSEPADEETTAWIRDVLSSRSMLTVELLGVPRNDNPLNDYRWANYSDPEEAGEKGEFTHDNGDVAIRADGAVETGVFVETVLDTIYRPGLEDNLAFVDRARLRVTLNGEVVETRPLDGPERAYLEAYDEMIRSESWDSDPPEAPDLRLTTLEGREALRAATLLRWPTDVRFGVSTTRCRA